MATKTKAQAPRPKRRGSDEMNLVRAGILIPPERLIDGRYRNEFEKALDQDNRVAMVLQYVHDEIGGPLLRQIRVLQRAALIATACEHYAEHGRPNS
jgi:hypothetical protein